MHLLRIAIRINWFIIELKFKYILIYQTPLQLSSTQVLNDEVNSKQIIQHSEFNVFNIKVVNAIFKKS